MGKLFVMLAAVAGIVGASATADRAGAVPFGATAGIRGAMESLGGAESVHCVSGMWHHRFSPHDGCLRVYSAPRSYIAPRPRYRAYRWNRWRRW